MRSTIIRLYDYKQAVIPAEMLRWRVPDEEIAAQLETLSHNHAFETEADTVQTGDSVACRGESESARWNRETLLFFPGRGLCEPGLENACVGAKLGESRTASTPEGEVTLTVKRIVRRSNMPVGDELVQAEGIGGVRTVAEYYDWYRESKREENRRRAKFAAAYFLLGEIRDHSEIFLDKEEQDEWVWDRVNALYDAMVEAGMDPRIPREGFDFLTEEQAKAKMYQDDCSFFTDFVVQVYMAEKLTGKTIEEICGERLRAFAQENQISVEELERKNSRAIIYGRFAQEAALELLGEYTEQFLEE